MGIDFVDRNTQRMPALADAGVGQDVLSSIYETFLPLCRPAPEEVLALLRRWGITAEAIRRAGVCLGPDQPAAAMRLLHNRFSTQALIASGLLTVTHLKPTQKERMVASSDLLPLNPGNEFCLFHPYDQAKVPYLLFPYRQGGQVLHLRARPLWSPRKLDQFELPRQLASSVAVPCLFNSDELAGARVALIFQRELDALMAQSIGLPAVACPSPAQFKARWARQCAGKVCHLLLEGRRKQDQAVKTVVEMFENENLPPPTLHTLPEREQLAQYLIESFSEYLPKANSANGDSTIAGAISPVNEGLYLGGKQFVAAIPVGQARMVLVHRVEAKQMPLVRFRYWRKAAIDSHWERDDRMDFVIPLAQVNDMIEALQAAAEGRQSTLPPKLVSN